MVPDTFLKGVWHGSEQIHDTESRVHLLGQDSLYIFSSISFPPFFLFFSPPSAYKPLKGDPHGGRVMLILVCQHECIHPLTCLLSYQAFIECLLHAYSGLHADGGGNHGVGVSAMYWLLRPNIKLMGVPEGTEVSEDAIDNTNRP